MKRTWIWILLYLFSVAPGHSQCLKEREPAVMRQVKPTILLRERIGEAVPVTELDLSALLMARVREASRLGFFDRELKKTRHRLAEHAREPAHVDLPPSREVKTHRIAMLSEEAMKDLEAHVKKALLREKRRYLFFDASDRKQADWAASFYRQDAVRPLRLIAVRGDRIAFEKTYDIPLYADQGAVLTRRFSLKSLPSVVTLAAKEALVTTYPIGDAP